jgi:hypothetical protein
MIAYPCASPSESSTSRTASFSSPRRKILLIRPATPDLYCCSRKLRYPENVTYVKLVSRDQEGDLESGGCPRRPWRWR